MHECRVVTAGHNLDFSQHAVSAFGGQAITRSWARCVLAFHAIACDPFVTFHLRASIRWREEGQPNTPPE